MSRSHHLGDLQLRIMRVLWAAGEATVAHVHRALETQKEGRALTTVATMLSKMEKKGVIDHRMEGRVFVYRPLVSETEVQRSMVDRLTEVLFAGDTTALVSHLIREREIDSEELDSIQGQIARAKREGGDSSKGEVG